MQPLQSASKRTLLVLVALLGCQMDAVAATGVTACDSELQATSPPGITLADYSDQRQADNPKALLKKQSALSSSTLPLTASAGTRVLRDDHVKSDLELPVKEARDADPEAAAILLERRNSRLRKTSDDETVEMNTRLPGMDADEMLQFRQQMYRTDI